MGHGSRLALTSAGLLAAGLLLAAFARAQSPPPAVAPHARTDTTPQDTLAPHLLYDETLPPNTTIVPRVTLQAGMVYRIETQPGEAVSVSYSRQPAAEPLLLVPLGGGGPTSSGSQSFLVVPRVTAEYRLDIQWTQTDPVRLTIWTDPKEMSRWARMRAATAGQPAAGVSVRAVYYGPFVRPGPEFNASAGGRGTADAAGVQVCLAVVPRGEWISGPVGGCVLAVSRLFRPDSAGSMWLLSTEPRLMLSSPQAAIEHSVFVTAGIGTTVGAGSTDYVILGLGYDLAVRALGPHLWFEAQAGVMRMQQLGSGFNPLGKASIVPRLGGGLQLRF